eukprot:684213-Rhodomonas_salina.3
MLLPGVLKGTGGSTAADALKEVKEVPDPHSVLRISYAASSTLPVLSADIIVLSADIVVPGAEPYAARARETPAPSPRG